MQMSTKPFALITGASSGIGLELAKVFAEEGYDLLITAEKGIQEASRTIEQLGAKVDSYEVDLSEEAGVDELIAFADSLGRPIEVAVLNAGAGVGGDFARETNLEDEERIIRLNCLSTVRLAKWAVKNMLSDGKGRLMITSSVVSVMPAPLQLVYGATKAFVHSFAEGLREELRDTEITVTSLQPGATDTKFFEGPGLPGTKVDQMKKDDPAKVARQGFDALQNGDDHIVAGNIMNKIQIAVNKFLPERAKTMATRSYGEKAQ
jgi:short-subunit dehydrogenase